VLKDLESFKYGEGTGEPIQDRGLKALFKQITKAKGNILEAFNGFLTNYLQQEVGYENVVAFARVFHFIMVSIQSSSTKPAEHPLFLSRLLEILSLSELPLPETPSLCLLTFRLFPSHRD